MRWIALVPVAFAIVACSAPQAIEPSAHQRADRNVAVSDAAVEAALARAGANRAEIERYLARYEQNSDPQERLAARWLVANMIDHGFAKLSLEREDGTVVPFDATEHANLAAARAELERLEADEGNLSFGLERFDADLCTISADQLIDNQELAFAAWRTAPWASSISFATFLEHILPYRGSDEALDPTWRAAARDRMSRALTDLRESLGREPTLDEASRAAIRASKKWVKFRQLYYLHPTDQSWSEMIDSKAGRCEDQSNVAVFAARSIGAVVAGDFTPYWADRDNNHAWEVVLDEHGVGSARLAHRPAKIYRRMFSAQPGSLDSLRSPGERVAGSISERGLLDVTRQYVDTSDVTLHVGSPPSDERFAYLCVYNGGAWRPVHHALVEGGNVRFTDMGRGVLYLPAWLTSEGFVGAANPFLLRSDGHVTELTPSGQPRRIELQSNFAGHVVRVWSAGDGRWLPAGSPDSTGAIELDPGLLYLRQTDEGSELERPFTIDGATIHRW